MRRLLPWTAVILWMALLFYLSAQEAETSDQLSVGITEKIVAAIENVVPDAGLVVERMNHVVRKNAHFFAYLILGVLMANSFCVSGIHGFKGIIAALALCILYAVSDEIHQLFVPGRSGQITDVLIDSAGAAIGSFITESIRTKGRKRKASVNRQAQDKRG